MTTDTFPTDLPGVAWGIDSYIRYCAGIAVVQFPNDDSIVGIHNYAADDDEMLKQSAPEIVMVGERLMIDGIRRVIQTAFKMRKETVDFREMEQRFNDAEPGMRTLIEQSFLFHGQQLDGLNVSFSLLRPAVFLDEVVYRHICHGNYDRLTALDLMDGYTPHYQLLEAAGTKIDGVNLPESKAE